MSSQFDGAAKASGSGSQPASPGLGRSERARLEDLLTRHLARYPLMAVADAYKLLHQSAMGPGHAVPNRAAAREWLEEEASATVGSTVARDGADAVTGGELVVDTVAPMLERIAPDGALVRVHLRPYVAAGRDLEALLAAFVETAASFVPRPDVLDARLTLMHDLAAEGRLPFDPAALAEAHTRAADLGFPAMSHSDAFRRAYRPAYRVVEVDRLRAASSPTVST